MTPRQRDEFRALRATIRQRGTARLWITLVGVIAWAALTLATAALAQLPVATLLPLLVLAVTFEINATLYRGIERIGRYLEVFFETAGDAGWEHYAFAYARQFPGGGDPLFAGYFLIATVFNFVPVLTAGPVPLEWAFVGTIHLLFALRVFLGRRDASRHRAVDLERFQHLRGRS